jgi:uncharacterized damage-inducible protein DinB
MGPLIAQDYLRVLARYNRWQNGALFAAASTLDDAARRAERGAFWGSIHGTCAHLLWADRIWLSRFDLVDKPPVPLADSARWIMDWAELGEKRRALDDLIVEWCDGFAPGPVEGALTWFSGVAGREVTVPLSIVLAHIFNHQTHHRGQVHAMLTATGSTTEDTDLFLMPPTLWPPA